jgi:RNA recognition motif-containing protein
MSFEMSDKELNELFRKVRNVIDVRVAIDRRTGQPRGFAHADFTDVESATKAREFLQGMEIHNRRLVADYALSSRDVQHSDRPQGGRSQDE